ncbi:HIT family protein [Sphaerisporangium album]|uniref:HIT family protein n=2 Tax=Sphaerisporangium album TaxID=509200 RepID=A0A367FN93_9ACTN|nr:HIT family protein [Sphaerisporangium album]
MPSDSDTSNGLIRPSNRWTGLKHRIWTKVADILGFRFAAFRRPKGDRTVTTCLFCHKDDPSLNRVMCENSNFYSRYDNFPATPGHIEIVPKRHVISFFDLSQREIKSAYSLIRQSQQILDRAHSPDGYTIGVNEGVAAGRSVDHLHIHVIPRYMGDVPDPRGGIRQIVPNCDPDAWKNPLDD